MPVLTTDKPSKTRSVRLAFARVIAPAPRVRTVAHAPGPPEQPTRCPACELRDYLES
jgi:hypothetical protein